MAKPIFAFKDEGRGFVVADWDGEEFYEIYLPAEGEIVYLVDQNKVEYVLKRREK